MDLSRTGSGDILSFSNTGTFQQCDPADESPPDHQEGGGNMRYALALVCPPLALLTCKRWVQAIPSAILYALAIAWAKYGFGALIEFVLILWAFNVVGDEKAGRDARAFVKTVEPIPIIRS
jgi:hypothetical protein